MQITTKAPPKHQTSTTGFLGEVSKILLSGSKMCNTHSKILVDVVQLSQLHDGLGMRVLRSKALGGLLGASGAVLGASWGALGAPLGASWGRVGPS